MDARNFGPGQICGPFGPQFAGFAQAPKPPLWQRFGATAGIAVAIAATAGALIIAGVK